MGDDRPWAHESPSLRGLSYRFGVRTDDEELGRRVDAVLEGLWDTGPVEHWYELTASSPASVSVRGAVDVTRDGQTVALAQSPDDALGWLVWDVNRAAADASGMHLLFHAGAVQLAGNDGRAGTGVLLPGPSGSGKSTLCAGLVRAGMAYLSDELVALDLTTGRLLPYPKPITVKEGSFALLRDVGAPDGRVRGDGVSVQEWLLAVGAVGCLGEPCGPGYVVVPRYEPGVPTRLEPVSETRAFLELSLNAVNLIDHGDRSTEAMGALVAGCECAVLTMSDLDEACSLLLAFVGLREAQCAR